MSQLPLGSWEGTPADALRFRVGSVQVWLELSGERYRVSTCGLVYSDNGLPSATLSLPLGKELGPSASPDSKPLFDPSVFKKFAPAKVLVTFIDTTIADSSIGVANDPGEWVALDGFVSAVQFQLTGAENVQATVQILSSLAMVSTVNSVYGRFTMLHSYQSYIPMAAGADGAIIPGVKLPKDDVWGLVMDAVEYVVGSAPGSSSNVQGGNGRNVAQELLKNEGNPSVKRLIKALESPSLTAASQLRERFISHTQVATETMEPTTRSHASNKMTSEIMGAVKAGQSGGTLLSQLIQLCQDFHLNVVGLASKAHVIPNWPTWTSTNIRTIPAGASFNVRLESGQMDAATIAVGALVGSITPGADISEQTQKLLYQSYAGAYLIPNAEQYGNHAVFVNAQLPAYLGSIGITIKPKSEQDKKVPDEVKLTVGTSPTQQAPPKPESRPQDFTKEAGLAKAFGRKATYESLFGSRTMVVTTALRQDIVPGSNIRVDNPLVNEGYKSLSLVGYVSQVQITIDANANMASTTYQMHHVRYVDEQTGIIDQDDEGVANRPFLWQDRSSEVNSLTLWDKV